MITITRNIGKVVILFLNNTGNFFIFFTKVIQSLFKPWYFKNILSQMIFIGYLIPGLISSWMDRQGVLRTMSIVLIISSITRLIIISLEIFTYYV